MRIALVGPTHPYKGGVARHTTELAHRLADAGHDVLIESWRAQYPAALYPGRQTLDVPEGPPYPRTRRELAWYRPDGWYRAGRRLRRTVDLVVLVLLSPVQVPPYLVLRAGCGRAVRTLALCHNVLPHERRPTDAVLVRALLGRVDTVLTHAPEQRALAERLAGPATEVRMAELPPHPPGTVTRRARPADGVRRRLLFFGFVRPYKGVDVLLRALAAAPPDVELTVAGEVWGGSQGLRALAARLGVAGRVRWREGYVPAEELAGLFADCDAVVLPYRSATATQNVWLAHSYGLPVVATRAGALSEHVRDGVDGLLCAPDDPADLARAITECYTPGRLEHLRAGVRPADAEAYWARYLAALTDPRRS